MGGYVFYLVTLTFVENEGEKMHSFKPDGKKIDLIKDNVIGTWCHSVVEI